MTSITEDILEWSEKYLEPKNEYLGDVPVCPYARMARLTKKHIEYWNATILMSFKTTL